MLEFLKVIFLGIVEGITEWLPISSTGHMILVDEFVKLNVTHDFMEMFLVVIQLGAIPVSYTHLDVYKRQVFGVGFALLLPVFFGLDGVLYSMPVSDILTFIISVMIIAKTYRELNEKGV